MFQVAFGMIGLDRESFWEMTPREFFNAWKGFYEHRKREWDIQYFTAGYNAMRTAFSEKQQKQIQKDKAPWHSTANKQGTPMSGKQIEAMLNLIARPKTDGGS